MACSRTASASGEPSSTNWRRTTDTNDWTGTAGGLAGQTEDGVRMLDPASGAERWHYYREDVEFAGRREPLASDLTTPLAYHFVRSPLPILQEVGLLDPQWLEKLAGLYMLHPYEPGKIPVVLVHGLRSIPAA